MARRQTKVGLAPGTLIHVGDHRSAAVTLSGMRFQLGGGLEEHPELEAGAVRAFAAPDWVSWVDVNGVHDLDQVRRVGADFNLHPLLLEDIVNTTQRPKGEDYGETYFLVFKMIFTNPETGAIEMEQVSVVLGAHWVLTFQEQEADTFDPVRRRLQLADSRVRSHGADFLLYALVDTVVDNYLLVVEQLGGRIEDLEPSVLGSPDEATLEELYAIKRALVTLRRFAGPTRDALAQFRRAESFLVQPSTRLYLRDVEDHLQRVAETIDLYRDMLGGMVDAYLSSLSNRLNDVMRVLTVISTIFIPLTFIVGVYGMNFDTLPELHWRWSYPIVWAFMLAVGAGLLVVFRRRKWL